MSDRIKGLTVTLRPELRDDDAEPTIAAIRMIKGVIDVQAHVADPAHHMAVIHAKQALREPAAEALRKIVE